jgi:hypothetical protein
MTNGHDMVTRMMTTRMMSGHLAGELERAAQALAVRAALPRAAVRPALPRAISSQPPFITDCKK